MPLGTGSVQFILSDWHNIAKLPQPTDVGRELF